MQKSLATSFKSISLITKEVADNIENCWNTFSYALKPESFIYAEKGLIELEKNLAFTLLINPKIKSVTIDSPILKKSYVVEDYETSIKGIRFASLTPEIGLLYQKSGKLTFGIPTSKHNGHYHLLPISNQAILYKEFPLIGTEGFNLPVFIQHDNFQPTEQRDAIRTKLNSEEEKDPTAEKNRKALIEFVQAYILFMEKIIDAQLSGSYLFAKSGLPDLVDTFSDTSWFEKNIQIPIRNNILQRSIVITCSGQSKKIAESKFISRNSIDYEGLFELASKLIPEQMPNKNSIWHWAEIISQNLDQWPNNIILKIEDLLESAAEIIDLNDISSFEWLKELYQFLDKNNLNHLGDKYYIYPNEANQFCLKDDVRIHPNIDEEFKTVSKGLGRPLEDEFLNRKVGKLSNVQIFDLQDFYKKLNNELIGELKVESASEEQIKSIFHICCLFRSDRAPRREKWFKIINQILLHLAPEKKAVSVDYENYGRSAEFWSIRYICHLIETANKPTVFAEEYFEGSTDLCFSWFSDFLSYIFEIQEESKETILKKRIIPVQSDNFRPYDDFIFAEQDSKYFDETIKNIYKDYTHNGDPRKFIVDTRISCDAIKKKDISILTDKIDDLFNDEHIESKIKKGGNLNEMFLQLNDWFEQFSTSSTLRTFSNKRASLYVLALGEGFSKQIMEIQSSGKSIDDIRELAKIQLSTQEMKSFESAATELGTSQLLAKAQEMIDAKHQIERWKTIGRAAENVFKETLSNTEPDFEIQNPDIGKDFVIIVNGKQYAIEIKSVEAQKGNVNMSLRQGRTAVTEKEHYALCVLTRPEDDSLIDEDYFIRESRFVPDIGYQIGNTIEEWDVGITKLDTMAEVKVTFDEKSESVYIGRSTWKAGITFHEFVIILKQYYELTED